MKLKGDFDSITVDESLMIIYSEFDLLLHMGETFTCKFFIFVAFHDIFCYFSCKIRELKPG